MCLYLDELYLPYHLRCHWVKGQGHCGLFHKSIALKFFFLTTSKLHTVCGCTFVSSTPDLIRGHGVKGPGHQGGIVFLKHILLFLKEACYSFDFHSVLFSCGITKTHLYPIISYIYARIPMKLHINVYHRKI